MWDTLAEAPFVLVQLWVWRSSDYFYASMELLITRYWGHTLRSPLALYATSKVATSQRPSNLQLAYMVQNLVLGQMMSVMAASVPPVSCHFSAEVFTAVASAS